MTKLSWTDSLGVQRDGELVDQISGKHPQFGQVTATLYRVPEAVQTKEHCVVELYMASTGKTHQMSQATLEDGQKRMAQVRQQIS